MKVIEFGQLLKPWEKIIDKKFVVKSSRLRYGKTFEVHILLNHQVGNKSPRFAFLRCKLPRQMIDYAKKEMPSF